MSWDVKVGDRVVCIDDSPTHGYIDRWFFGLIRRWVPTISVLEGERVYTVSLVAMGSCASGGEREPGIQVAEITPSHPCGAFPLRRFRPVRTTSIDCLLVHLNTVREDA